MSTNAEDLREVRDIADRLVSLADSRVDITTMTGDALCAALHEISVALHKLADIGQEQDA